MTDFFRRDLQLQTQMKSGESGTKRRKYVCFEQIFLMSQTQDGATSSNYSPKRGRNGEEDTDERREVEPGSSDGISETSLCRKQQRESNTSRKISYKQQLLDIPKEKSELIDEGKTFLLSLVPGFKKLNDDQKHWAKMKMPGIMSDVLPNQSSEFLDVY